MRVVFALLLAGAVLCGIRLAAGPEPARADARGEPGGESTAALDLEPLETPLRDARIVVYKARRTLELYSGGRLVRVRDIGLGTNPVDDKRREGDGCTPEGAFTIRIRNPRSRYYLSLGLSYPNREDADRGLREGLITRNERDRIVAAIDRGEMPPQKTALGGEIFIHGRGAGSDWTLGCVALNDDDMLELFNAVPLGTPVIIKE